MDNKNIFAANLKRYMRECGKSRREVSGAIGVSYYTFTDWYNGKKYPRMDKVERLANYFGILKSDLIEDKAEKESLEEDMKIISGIVDSLDGKRLDAALEIAKKIAVLDDDEVNALLAVVRSMGKKA